MKDIDESYVSQQGKEFEICVCLCDMLTYYYCKLCKKTHERGDKLLFLTGITRSIMLLCLDLYKGDRDKGRNTIYFTIEKLFFYYIGTTQSKFDVLKKQMLIGIANKFENIDPEELLNRHLTKKMNDTFMAGIDVVDLYGKALSAVKKY